MGGAGSVLLRKPRTYAEVYNDLDGEVVNLFRVLRNEDTAEHLIEKLHNTPFARAEFELSYEPACDEVEQARRTVVRSFMGFGSAAASGHVTGFRANSNRSGTTPAHDWMHFPDVLPAIIERLRGVVIENRPAHDVILQHDSPATLFYIDPPYPHEVRHDGSESKELYRHEMTEDDHRELADVLFSVKGMVVISGYPCDLYDEDLYAGWHRVTRNALADGARKRTEVLWMNTHSEAWSKALPLFQHN